MASNWNEFTTPGGDKYYYNLETKQSTLEKPAGFDDQKSRKRQKLQHKPKYLIPLDKGWSLVLCNTGTKFYHNKITNESHWTLDDPCSIELLQQLDKEKLVLLIGISRGYYCPRRNVYDEIINDLKFLKDKSLEKQEVEPEMARADEEQVEYLHQGEEQGLGLVTGYGSSDDSEDENIEGEEEKAEVEEEEEEGEEEEEEEKAGEQETVDQADIDELNNLSEHPQLDAKNRFTILFDKYNLDPYSMWEFQSRKINKDPDFYLVTNDSSRKDLFEQWCTETIANSKDAISDANINENDADQRQESEATQKEEQEEEKEVEEDSDPDDENLEPTRFHYLSHIISKSSIEQTTIFLDIKKENKALFKTFRIKSSLKKKDQEDFASKLLFYYKRMDLEQRKLIFQKLLLSKSDIIRSNLRNVEKLRDIVTEQSMSADSYAIETQLLMMEDCMDIHGKLSFLQGEVHYYVLGIKDKTIQLKQFLQKFT